MKTPTKSPSKSDAGSTIHEVLIGTSRIKVDYREMDDLCGRWHGSQNQSISIHNKMPVDEQNRTILHETMHAISEMYGLELSERDIRTLEQVLSALVRDNPALFKALMK